MAEGKERSEATGAQAADVNRVMADRLRKVRELREAGLNPYANDFQVAYGDLAEAAAAAPETLPAEDAIPEGARLYKVAGRVVAAARFGKAAFFKIRSDGHELQVYVRRQALDEQERVAFKKCEVGDFIGAWGRLFATRKGKTALKAERFELLTKAVRPLPEKFHGLKDPELRYRMRYVDLVANPEVADVFRKRSRLVRFLRDFLEERGFVEVETPMMHPLVGGAAARPFVTRHNALDMELYLRIAPELYLKRLLVGGFERVYELGRCFRNEGLSRRHNPEFTMLEFYVAYATYEDLMELSQEMLSQAAEAVAGSTRVSCFDAEGEPTTVDFAPPWPRISMLEAISEGLRREGFDWPAKPEDLRDEEALSGWIERARPGDRDEALQVALDRAESWGERIGALFDWFGEPVLPRDRPVFVVDFPLAISPLSRPRDSDPAFVDRFEIFVAGEELGNAFSELNDPEDQRRRFQEQVARKARGAQETMDYDEDYCRALEFGMPPAAGEGIGIDRLTMFLTGQRSIRDVILFPLLRPERGRREG